MTPEEKVEELKKKDAEIRAVIADYLEEIGSICFEKIDLPKDMRLECLRVMCDFFETMEKSGTQFRDLLTGVLAKAKEGDQEDASPSNLN